MAARTVRKPLTEAAKAKITAEREAKVAEAAKILEEAVTALLTADGWQAMIEARQWLRKYSFTNLMLIQAQCPGATDVRPYGARVNPSPGSWKAVGRYAVPESKAIRIYAPLFRKNADGDQELYGFKLVPVFDVSQTDGEPLPAAGPEAEVTLLTGDAPAELWDRTAKLIAGHGFSIERCAVPDAPKANGQTRWAERRVIVRQDVSDAQAVKTLIHELAHIELDHMESNSRTETEAESVACIVTRYAGLVSLQYSVGYVAGWAGTTEQIEASAKTVFKTADKIIEALGL